jgi:acylphosphatase
MKKTIEIIASGQVQGVFYRQSTREKAGELGLTGFVENLSNGDVRIVATGETSQLEKLVEWAKAGPPKAVVHSISKMELAFWEFDSFDIKRKF